MSDEPKFDLSMNRRGFTVGASALLAALGLGRGVATAGDRKVHFVTWASADGTAMVKIAGAAFEKATGATLVADQPPASTALISKIKAAGDQQWADVVTLLGSNVLELSREGLLQTPDAAQIPNLQFVPEKYRLMYNNGGIGFGSAVYGLTYSKKVFDSAPKSLATLWNPDYAGRLLLPPPNIIHAMQLVIIAGKLVGVDAFEDPDKAFAKLAELKGRVLTMSTQPQQVGELFRNGDIAVGYTSLASLSSVIKNPDYGIGVSIRELAEGWVTEIIALSIPKGHPNADADTYAFINQILTPEVAQALQEAAWYVPLISTATTPQALLDQGFPGPADLERAITYDLTRLAAVRQDWTKRYSEIFNA
ncbi:MAG: extracellular solute-binding protein [Zavarzinia sp.]|nr:extracellular solute-binding protein [Zavarzinia sp.]